MDGDLLGTEDGGRGRRRMADQIVEDFLSAIGAGELVAGANVPAESALSTQYGVSRSVVREAVRTLAAKGFVIASQGSATTVAPRTAWNVLDPAFLAVNSGEDFFDNLQQARELLEPTIAALAAQTITDLDIERLEELHARFDLAKDADEHARADIEFHEAIAAASGNPVLVAVHTLISSLAQRTRARSAELPGAVERAKYWHGEILTALKSRSAADSERAMRLHLRQVRGELETLGFAVGGDDRFQ